jgi:plastocyanin
LPNLGGAPHNFSIDELDISVDIAPGETGEVQINAPAGTYEFYCNVPGHREAGMVGTLIVSEDAALPEASPPSIEEEPAAESPEADAAAAEEAPAGAEPVTIESHDIFFEPAEVTIPADTDVTVSLPNEGAAPHNFSIDELEISVDLAPGETKETVINAPPGEYEYYCNVPGHREAGMVGTLIVE